MKAAQKGPDLHRPLPAPVKSLNSVETNNTVQQKMNPSSAIELHDTGRVPLLFRIASAVFGSLGLFGACKSFPSVGAILAGALGVCLLAIWFLRTRIYYDAERRELISRSALFSWTERVPLSGADAILMHGFRTVTGSGFDIEVRFEGGRKRWITRAYDKVDAERIATSFSRILSLPIAAT